ncbi:hypothetical protein C9374_007858 [Naegleria lovaniensis]|uniref:B30.2/SPRY domain-containing protein n=1 Tax=Naegleria lovaniensis TaxID=51637 RepID=A0AA88GL05_NAELO|nr:uncharacterized protein C9374_007858 [Naegleria lovaniensis]KAG2378710.1 hypothetical protein C9374_007858 [Naegleria lovaniensis]
MAAPSRSGPFLTPFSSSNHDDNTQQQPSTTAASRVFNVLSTLSQSLFPTSLTQHPPTIITTTSASSSSSSSSSNTSSHQQQQAANPTTIPTISTSTTSPRRASLHLSLTTLEDPAAITNHPLVLPSPSHFKRFFLNERSSSHPFHGKNSKRGGFFHCYDVKTLISNSNNFSLDNSLRLHSQKHSLLIHRSQLPNPQQQNNNGAGAAGTPPPAQWSPTDLPCMQFNHPSKISHLKSIHTNSQFTYFEVKIAESMYSGNNASAPEVGIGFAPAGFKGMVGWAKDTIAFHMDNGRVYDERDSTNRIADRVFLSNVSKGDVIGCLLNHRNGEFLVVRNGQELHNLKHGTVFVNDKFKRHHQDPVKYLPTISCSDINLEVEVNLGLDLVQFPFVYPRVIHCKEREKMFGMVKNHDQMQHSPSLGRGENCCRFSDVEIWTVSE